MSWLNEAWEKLDKKLSKTAVKSFDKIPYSTTNGVHDNREEDDICWWTNGFWGALMVLMYNATKNQQYLDTARNSCDILDGAFLKCEELHHDVGFMWNISSGADYRITGDEKQKNRFALAANMLMGRFNADAGFIRAWNHNWNGWAIIDCMMNIPLLYRASEEYNDDRFAMVARRHADKTAKYHVRADGSCNHINEYDHVTGEFVKAYGGQGYGEGSSWSRGQAWGIYGFALAYKFDKNPEYLATAKKIAHYFMANVERSGYVPLCDFRQPKEPVIYDTTAGACAACGLLEIAKFVPELEKEFYIDCAEKMLRAIYEGHCNFEEDEDSVVQNGTEAYTQGIHKPIIYGDYFFAEGLCRLKGIDVDFMW